MWRATKRSVTGNCAPSKQDLGSALRNSLSSKICTLVQFLRADSLTIYISARAVLFKRASA